MASTQTSLNQFFKARKSARDVHSLKNGKPVIKDDIKPVQTEYKCDIVTENTDVKSDAKTEAVVFAKPEAKPRRAVARSSKPSSRNSSSKRGEKSNNSGEDIFEALKRAAAKQTQSKFENGTKSEDETSSASTTPKRKKEENEEIKIKKRREVNETDLSHTPQEKDLNNTPATPKSAKKSLFTEPRAKNIETNEIPNKEVQEVASPSKVFKSPLPSPSKVFKSPRKMTPAEVKETLGKCGRLDILRERLLKVNQTGEKLREFKENQEARKNALKTPPPSPRKVPPSPRKAPHPQLKQFDALDVNIPISPRKTPLKTPIKTPNKLPAFKRYAHLIAKPSEELVLPGKYKLLKEFFRAVDTVISILHNRQEAITYSKLKPAVEEMMRKAFYEKHLGQIKTIFPVAYIFKQEKKRNCGGGVKGGGYQLTVAPNMNYKSEKAFVNLMDKFEPSSKDHTSSSTYQKMNSVAMVERRNIFHNCLVEIVKDQHDQFLKSLDPPILNSSDDIKRWHPEFELEDVMDIETGALPQPPEEQKFDTAKDVLDKASDMFSVNPRMEAAMTAIANTKPEPEPKPVTAEPPKPVTPINSALKGISSSLLEKIRAREAAKTAREMTRTKTENKELERLSRLPEIARIIRNVFVTEKKAALPWEMITSKVSATYSGMLLPREADDHLNVLIKEVPGWATICKVRSGVYIKINRNTELGEINDKLQAALKAKL